MEVRDYSTKLADAKADFTKANQELRKNLKEERDHIEKVSDNKIANQSKVHIRESQEKDKLLEAETIRMQKEMAEAINNRQEQYRNGLNRESKEFALDRKELQSSYDNKLNNISHAYKRAVEDKDRYAEAHENNINQKFDSNSQKLKKEFNENLAQISENNQTEFNQFRDQQLNESRMLNQSHTDDIRDQKISEIKSKDELQKMSQFERDNIKNANELTVNNLKRHQEESLESLNMSKEQEVSDLTEKFQKVSNNLNEKSQNTNQNLIKSTQQQIVSNNEEHSQDLNNLKRKHEAVFKSGIEDTVEDEKNRLTQSYEGQIKNLKQAIEDNNFKNTTGKERLNREQQKSLENIQVNHLKKETAQENDLAKFKKYNIAELKGDKQELLEHYQRVLKKEELAEQQNLLRTKDVLKGQIESQRSALSEQMKSIQEVNGERFKDLQTEIAQEKSDFIKKTRQDTFIEREELKDHLRTGFVRKEESLQKKIDHQKDKNEEITETYEKRLKQLDTIKNEEIKELKLKHHGQDNASEIAFRRTLKMKEKEKQEAMTEIRKKYETQLTSQKNNNDQASAKLISKYEKELAQNRKNSKLELESRLREQMSGSNQKVATLEFEKDVLIQQYEEKITNLKEANQNLQAKAQLLAEEKLIIKDA